MSTFTLALIGLVIVLQLNLAHSLFEDLPPPPLLLRENISREEMIDLVSNLKVKGDQEWQNKRYQRALDYYDEASQELKAHKDSDTDADMLKLLASIYYQYGLVFQATGELDYAKEACEYAIGTCLRTMACDDYLEPFALFARLNELKLETAPLAIRDHQYVIDHLKDKPGQQFYVGELTEKIAYLKKVLHDWNQEQEVSKDHYKTLNVSCDASQKDITNAYRNLAKQFHPDRNVASDALTRQLNELRFKHINEAHTILKNPVLRSKYDSITRLERCFRF